ncbi:MAG: prepilin peptidase [Bdellovibrionia bacterium]
MFDLGEPFWLVVFFIFGALMGSFANVIIYRMPKGQSIVLPGSHCQSCQKPVRWFDNIPIFSWFILKGKCRHCGAKYSFRYVLVELLTAGLFALAFHYFGFTWSLLEALLFLFPIVVCIFIDFDHMILPDEFTLSGIVIGLLGAWLNPSREFMPALLGVFFGGGFLWALAYLYYVFTKNEGMGGGDIKLLAWIGAVLGWEAIPFVIMSSAITGSIVGLTLAIRSREGLKTAIPFGPYLALGGVLYLFGGQTIGDWYLQLFFPSLN